jgi:hypothetical protein
MDLNERRRRDCSLFSIDLHFPKLAVVAGFAAQFWRSDWTHAEEGILMQNADVSLL